MQAEPSESDQVPEDFPWMDRSENLASVPGAQPKLLVTKTATGYYTDTPEERREDRWRYCVDLREQLVDYALKKAQEKKLELPKVVEMVMEAVERKRTGWGMTREEVQWVASELRKRLQVV